MKPALRGFLESRWNFHEDGGIPAHYMRDFVWGFRHLRDADELNTDDVLQWAREREWTEKAAIELYTIARVVKFGDEGRDPYEPDAVDSWREKGTP